MVQAYIRIGGVLSEHGAGLLVSTPIAGRKKPTAHDDFSCLILWRLLSLVIGQDDVVPGCAVSHGEAVALKDRVFAEELPADRPSFAGADAIDQDAVIGEMLLERGEVAAVRRFAPETNHAQRWELFVPCQSCDELPVGSGDRAIHGGALREEPAGEPREARLLRVPGAQRCAREQRQENVVQRTVDMERKERGHAVLRRHLQTFRVEPDVVHEVAMVLQDSLRIAGCPGGVHNPGVSVEWKVLGRILLAETRIRLVEIYELDSSRRDLLSYLEVTVIGKQHRRLGVFQYEPGSFGWEVRVDRHKASADFQRSQEGADLCDVAPEQRRNRFGSCHRSLHQCMCDPIHPPVQVAVRHFLACRPDRKPSGVRCGRPLELFPNGQVPVAVVN